MEVLIFDLFQLIDNNKVEAGGRNYEAKNQFDHKIEGPIARTNRITRVGGVHQRPGKEKLIRPDEAISA